MESIPFLSSYIFNNNKKIPQSRADNTDLLQPYLHVYMNICFYLDFMIYSLYT